MIKKITFNNQIYELFRDEEITPEENIFTIVVGKNGTGKSTMLSSIVLEVLENYNDRFYNNNEIGFRTYSQSEIVIDSPPDNIIAVSSSPFDKFPVTRRFNDIQNYAYLGLRDLSSLNFGLSYMSKIIASLIESVHSTPSHWLNLANVLDYLGYRSEISAKFSFSMNKSELLEIISDEVPLDVLFSNARFWGKYINRRFFVNENGEIDINKVEHLKNILISVLNHSEYRPNKIAQIIINRDGINIESNALRLDGSHIIFLINSGVLRLRDIGLVKKVRGSAFSIKDSSSGEQSVIISILGIASKISNNSIICIDEPEICLHPEWQEKYIQILITTFSTFKNCHFIIATHSPQIISNLASNNCFVVSMEDAETTNANIFINNSIDFQLANVFKSPGFKNEYLGRIAFTIFSKVSKNKEFDSNDLLNYKILKDIFKSLVNEDPVKELISVLIELHKKYA
ncbi:ATP-binding protein [Dyadobacter frigoris]|uniref:AAA family ATPase n=1 Tax=Dyadobacter frigoris TaxID=2576211 RepID=UPI0024A0211E|nr:AAA family ATPase [Dyadobacter frigoris]GLU57220.1 ATP-binding protein [Dyadobacter frigoris]